MLGTRPWWPVARIQTINKLWIQGNPELVSKSIFALKHNPCLPMQRSNRLVNPGCVLQYHSPKRPIVANCSTVPQRCKICKPLSYIQLWVKDHAECARYQFNRSPSASPPYPCSGHIDA